MRIHFAPIVSSFVLLAFVVSHASWAQSSNTNWILEKVTCHEVGAVMTFEGRVEVQGGDVMFVLPNLPLDVDVSSVQMELPEGVELVAVNAFEIPAGTGARMEGLARQVEANRLALELEQALLEALDQERAFLEANRNIGGGAEVLLVDDVEEMRAYLVQRHNELALERVDVATQIRALQEELDRSIAEFDNHERNARSMRKNIELVLAGTGRGNAIVKVATAFAGWVSSYDVQWDEKENKLVLERFARLIQTTGWDWENVLVELRTGQPLSWNGQQETRTQLQQDAFDNYDGYCANVKWVNSGLSDFKAREDVLSGQGALSSNWSMEVERRVSVKGNGTPARLRLDKVVMDAATTWMVRPSVAETALRSCATYDWMDWRSLSGEARVFQGNALIGVMPLNMPVWGDSLVVQLGNDDLVRSTSELLDSQSGTRRMSGKRVVEQVRSIRVHNDGNSVATVDVQEQLPISTGWQMEVETSPLGSWNPETGEVNWTGVQVPASGSWEATLRIRVVVPKSGSLVGL